MAVGFSKPDYKYCDCTELPICFALQYASEVYPSQSTKWCATTSSNRSSLTKQVGLCVCMYFVMS